MLVQEVLPSTQTCSRALQQQICSLLQICKTKKELAQIHTQTIINGYTQKNFIIVKLLSSYLSFDCLQLAHQIFNQVENPSTTVWNQMIRDHAQSEIPCKSLHLFSQMEAGEASPNGFTYSFVLSACSRAGLLREGEQLHGRVLSTGFCTNLFVQTNLINLYTITDCTELGIRNARKVFDEMLERTVVTWNSLLVGYIRCGDFDTARRVFDEMPEKNPVSWTAMISGYAKNGRCKQALSLFGKIQCASVQLDRITLLAALSACADLGDLNLGKWIHSYINENITHLSSQPLWVTLNNALIHMYASCGVIEAAYAVFLGMQTRTSVSWTTLITGFAKQGCGKEALIMFQRMLNSQESDIMPDEVTFLGVLSACSHAGFVNAGRYYFKYMSEIWGIEPNIKHYGCMVDLLSRAGFLDEAYGLIAKMPLKPNDAVWGALLGGCRIHKNVKLASRVARELYIQLKPNRAAGYLVLLSNVFATAKEWEDVTSVRQKMIEMGVEKFPGGSWIQVDQFTHEFLSADLTHKQTSSIYAMLALVTSQAKLQGYKPDYFDTFFYVEEWNNTVQP